jgi:hypothetical protein
LEVGLAAKYLWTWLHEHSYTGKNLSSILIFQIFFEASWLFLYIFLISSKKFDAIFQEQARKRYLWKRLPILKQVQDLS